MRSYQEKIADLVDAMEKDGFQEFFEGDRQDAYDTVEDYLSAFPNYVNVVVRMETLQPIWIARYDGQEYRDKVTQIDNQRRQCHNKAIDAVNVLNRLSENLGLEPFADIDTSDRYKVADFVGEYVSEVYQDGQSHTMDHTVEYAESHRDSQYNHMTLEDLIIPQQPQHNVNPDFDDPEPEVIEEVDPMACLKDYNPYDYSQNGQHERDELFSAYDDLDDR